MKIQQVPLDEVCPGAVHGAFLLDTTSYRGGLLSRGIHCWCVGAVCLSSEKWCDKMSWVRYADLYPVTPEVPSFKLVEGEEPPDLWHPQMRGCFLLGASADQSWEVTQFCFRNCRRASSLMVQQSRGNQQQND